MVDDQGRIVLINHETERLFKYTADQLAGERVEVLVPHRYRGAHSDMRNVYFRGLSADRSPARR